MLKDTSPFIRSARIKRQIRIQEVNNPPSTLFDATVEYPSDELPEWFAPLQAIVEDETFTSMVIFLGAKTTPGKVSYRISVASLDGADQPRIPDYTIPSHEQE